MLNFAVDSIKALPIKIHNLIPEGRLKDFLRILYLKFINPLYDLDRIISKIEHQGDICYIELINGLKIYSMPDKTVYPAMKYANSKRLGRLADYKNYYTCLQVIAEQFLMSSSKLFDKLLPGNTVVDIGANIGVFTIKAAKAVGDKGKVIAIEPEPNNIEILMKNVKANDLNNIVIVPKGVWSSKGLLKLFLTDGIGGHSLLWDEGQFIQVEVDTLDNILDNLNIGVVHFIKIDIEGAEREALKGMEKTLVNNNITIVGEYHAVNNVSTYDTIDNQLKDKGYNCQREAIFFYAHKKTKK